MDTTRILTRCSATALLAAALVPAGCGGRAATVTTDHSQPASPSGLASSGHRIAAPRCRVGQLSVRKARQQGAAGSMGLVFELRNRSERRCSLYGYPGLQLIDIYGHDMSIRILRAPSVVVPPLPKRRVAIAPGGRAWFLAGYTDVSMAACRPAVRLEVTPPGAVRHLTIPTTMTPCGGQVSVSPVVRRLPTGI